MIKINSILIIFAVNIVVIYSAPTAKNDSNLVKLLSYSNEPFDASNKYSFGYQTDDGQERQEEGNFTPDQNGNIKHVVNGSYRYVTPDGNIYMVTYTADENGYQPQTMIIMPVSSVQVQLNPNAIKSLIG